MGRPDLAMQEFQSSAETEAAEVARANAAAVKALVQSGRLTLPLIDERTYGGFLQEVNPWRYDDLAGYVEKTKALRAAYPNFDFVPLVAAQVNGRIRQGDVEGAQFQLMMLERVHPGDPRVAQLRTLFGP